MSDGLDASATLVEIMNHKWLGDTDEQIDRWVTELDEMLDSCETDLGENELRSVYENNMALSTLFKEDIAHYRRQENEPGNESVYCSAWLKKCIIKHLARKQKQNNRNEQTRPGQANSFFNALPVSTETKTQRRRRGRSNGAPPPAGESAGGGSATALPATSVTATGVKTLSMSDLAAQSMTPPYLGICYYLNNGNCCTKGDKCSHKHVLIPESERSKMQVPQRRAPSAKGDGKGRGDSPARTSPHSTRSGSPAKSAAGTVEWPYVHRCFAFERDGTCARGDSCKWPHKTVQQIRSEMGNLRKQGITTNLVAGAVQPKG